MNSNNIHPESDCGNYPTPAPVAGQEGSIKDGVWHDKATRKSWKIVDDVAELPNEAEGKAKELVKAIKKINWRGDPESDKAIAAYCVDEILKTDAARYTHQEQYWQQVRTAINQL